LQKSTFFLLLVQYTEEIALQMAPYTSFHRTPALAAAVDWLTASSSAEEVSLLLTRLRPENKRGAEQHQQPSGEKKEEEEEEQDATGALSTPVGVTFADVQELSRELRRRACPLPAVFVHQLLAGARVAFAPAPVRERSEAFKQHLRRCQAKQDRREMDLATGAGGGGARAGDEGVQGLSKGMGMGVHILTLMATGFVVCWYLGRNIFAFSPNPVAREVYPVLCGLLGLICAMLMEITLFVIREGRMEGHELRKTKESPD
jgi:hypothetical protein